LLDGLNREDLDHDLIEEIGNKLAASEEKVVEKEVRVLVMAIEDGIELPIYGDRELYSDPRVLKTALAWGILSEMEKMGAAGLPEVPRLLRAFDKAAESNRAGVLNLIGEILGRAADDHVRPSQDVMKSLISTCSKLPNDPDRDVRKNAMEIVGGLRPSSEEIVRILVDFFDDPDPRGYDNRSNIRARAAYRLGIIGAEAKSAVPAIEEAFEKEEGLVVRRTMEEALIRIKGTLRPTSEENIRFLIEYLDAPDVIKNGFNDARLLAAEYLGLIGAEAKSAVPALEEAAKKEQQYFVRNKMKEAITLINKGVEERAQKTD
jgi:HEAT repeat protein